MATSTEVKDISPDIVFRELLLSQLKSKFELMGCHPFEDYLLIEAVLLAMLICFHEIVPPAAQNDNTEEISDTRGSYLASPFQSA